MEKSPNISVSMNGNGEKTQKNEPMVPNPSVDFEKMVSAYLANNPLVSHNRKVSELEIRFGTNSKQAKPISKIDYENVVKQLYASGFTTGDSDGLHILRIQNEYYDIRKEEKKMSNIRAEIVGIDLIQEYCKTNNIQKLLDMPSTISAHGNKIKFTQKSPPQSADGSMMKPVDFFDFNFRSSFQYEQDYSPESNVAKNIIGKWTDSKKMFRHMNRVRFSHPIYPVFADVSIVKGSKKSGRVPIPQYTIQDAGVFQNPENYEIELEVDNTRVGVGSSFDTPAKLMDALRKCIRIVLGGLQGTNYPISYAERERTLQDYMKLLHTKDYQERRILPKDFTGPSSYTLQVKNLIPNRSSNVPTILDKYTVTDKADGERKLLFIHENGRIYMIDTNMNVIFTGAYTKEKTLHNSLLDGEHIKYDKSHKYINLYAAFDIYYVHGKSVREFAFARDENDLETNENKFRLNLLKRAVELMDPKSIVETGREGPCDFHIRCKQFHVASSSSSIFEGCSSILSDIKQGIYEYNTDGLIFTPANTGVGSKNVGTSGPITKTTWEQSFKWKPADFNTIDFLVSFKKDKNGQDEVHNVFTEGKNLGKYEDVVQYKTLILRCGFDSENHRYINPFEDMLNDNIPHKQNDNEERYKPVPFQPTNPYDPEACFCNVLMNRGLLYTEENEVFEENMIIEFKYDISLEGAWKWKPLRIRYDKTAELRAGMKNYGNAYHVANSNWHSIHHPVTEHMIMTGQGIPEVEEDDDVYYNRTNDETNTKALRDFHNLFVKKRLILGVNASQRKQTLIDYAVGKAGDLPKWIRAKLGFVLGIDVSRDNILNSMDGACARYLNSYKSNDRHELPKAIFLHGNSGVNIRSGRAFTTDKEKMIARALFGNGPKERKELKDAVYNQYGVGQAGFNISSCQFALHYFFENNVVFHEFLRNLTECTALGGYFIGTCYDGKTVFQRLKNKRKEEGIAMMRGDRKIYEIIKMYDETGFPDDEQSIGYTVHVYQDSINKTFPEYLVNFDYFVRLMENYGFVLCGKEDAVKMGLPNGSGMFSELFTAMENEVKMDSKRGYEYGRALAMSEDEKWVSFMNRYFVFRKTHSVDAEKIYKQFVSKKMLSDVEKEHAEAVADVLAGPSVFVKEDAKPKAKKLAKKVVLEDYSPVSESADTVLVAPDVQAEPSQPTKPKLVIGQTIMIKRAVKK